MSTTIPTVRIWDPAGPYYMPAGDTQGRAVQVMPGDGTTKITVKPASTAPVATDTAQVVVLSPNQPTIPVAAPGSSTSTVTGVAASATSVTLAAANTNRLGLSIYNDTSSAILYVKCGTTATAGSGGNTTPVFPGGVYEVPFNYKGRVDGIWSAATGFANVDEFTP
jgi:hypothetical protein